MLVSLPSEWIKNHNLKKGNMVLIEINKDNSISLLPSDIDNEDVKEVTIPYPPVSMDSLVNQIYGAYLLGYNIIHIKGKSQISFDNRELIKHAMQKLVGLEIIDEDGFNLIKEDLIFKGDQFKEIEEDLLKQNKDLVTALLEQLKEKDIQIKEKDKQISEKDTQILGLQKLIENSQVLLREEQQQNANQLQLEEHIKQLDNRLEDVRERMEQRKDNQEKKGFFKRKSKK